MRRPLQWRGGRVEESAALLDYFLDALHVPLGAESPFPDNELKAIDPSEAPFAEPECRFDPLPFLGPFSAAAFLRSSGRESERPLAVSEAVGRAGSP